MSEKLPLHARLAEEMTHRIRTGVWKSGDRVPSEVALVAEFGVSRGPVRQALATLRDEGLIVGGRGAPPRVNRTAPAQHFDTFTSFTEWARELGLTPGQRIIEACRRTAPEETARELDLPPDSPIVEIIRLRTLNEKPAMLERSLLPWEIGRHVLEGELNRDGVYRTLAEAGITPVRARHVIDAVAAHPLEVEQLGVAPGAPLLRVRRLAYNVHGTVLETADDRYLPSMASFVIENSTEHRMSLMRGRGSEQLVG